MLFLRVFFFLDDVNGVFNEIVFTTDEPGYDSKVNKAIYRVL